MLYNSNSKALNDFIFFRSGKHDVGCSKGDVHEGIIDVACGIANVNQEMPDVSQEMVDVLCGIPNVSCEILNVMQEMANVL